MLRTRADEQDTDKLFRIPSDQNGFQGCRECESQAGTIGR